MNQSIRDLIDWEQPFPSEEYAERGKQVRAAMARAGIDGLFVTGAADLNYLTGYDQIWHAHVTIVGLFLCAEDDASLFFDNDAVNSGNNADHVRNSATPKYCGFPTNWTGGGGSTNVLTNAPGFVNYNSMNAPSTLT